MDDPIEELIACAKAGVFLGGNDIKRVVDHYEGIIKRIKYTLDNLPRMA